MDINSIKMKIVNITPLFLKQKKMFCLNSCIDDVLQSLLPSDAEVF